LRKPLDFYIEKYGSPIYGLLKMQILMNKQLNRGQDGAGVATIKLNPEFGSRYIARERSKSKYAVSDVFENIFNRYKEITPEIKSNITEFKKEYAFAGEVILGHLRYGTHGKHSIESVHPFLRQNNWMSRNLVLAGNYNMTNVKEMYQQLIDLGQQPKEISDNVTMLEKIGHFLDQENERLFRQYREETSDNLEIATLIKENLSLENVLKNSFKKAIF
jgi:amidophosphoribosyltransferase